MRKYFSLYWWIAVILFLLHQFTERVLLWPIPLFDNYLDSFLAMPIILGLHLAERRYFFRAGADYTLSYFEVIIVTVFLAIIFEEGFPLWREGFVRDPWDYMCYAFGAVIFLLLINKKGGGKEGEI